MDVTMWPPHPRSGGITEKDPFILTTSPSRSKIGQEAYDHFHLCEPSLKGITLDECSRPDRYLCLTFHVFYVRPLFMHLR